MSESEEQVRLREHLHQIRVASRGIAKDIGIEASHIEDGIARLPKLTAKEAKYAMLDLEDDLSRLGRAVDQELTKLPGRVASGVVAGATALGSGTVRLAGATKDAFESAGHMAKEGTRNAFAAAAGVKRTPMKQWTHPAEERPASEPADE
jgi:hypothetical protein